MRIIYLSLLLFTFSMQVNAQTCDNGTTYQFSDMVSIFTGYGCTNCHGSAGGLDLSDYINVTNGGTAGAGGCSDYMTPLSFLVGKIDGTLVLEDLCGQAMPFGIDYETAGMSTTEIAEIQTWIDDGAPEFCSTVPVTLTSFTAKESGNAIELSWSTAMEVNNAHFNVERSIDGRHFENIAEVGGSGTSNRENHYKIIDREPYLGSNYYRLVQVDLDGTKEYFRILTVNYKSSEPNFVDINPNPFQDVIQVSYKGPKAEKIQLTIFNKLGQLVHEERLKSSGGAKHFQINLPYLADGLYFTTLYADGSVVYSDKLIKN